MRAITRLGQTAWTQFGELRQIAAVIGTALYIGLRPWRWPPRMRGELARQIVAIGIEPLGFVSGMAVLVGISVVVQISYWVGRIGQAQWLGPLLVAVVARELGPVLTNLVVIVRSSSAMATELAVRTVSGQLDRQVARGADPFLHLVVPRVWAAAISTLCLAVVFLLVALASGYLCAAWLGKGSRDFLLFADNVAGALQPRDALSILAKTILPALFAVATCCLGGLRVGRSVMAIPAATQQALTRSVAGLLVISVTVSVLTYLAP